MGQDLTTKPLKRWYFSINEAGIQRQSIQSMITVAVRSCQATTSLKPYCLYWGEPRQELDILTDMGVAIIPHESSLAPELKVGYRDNYFKFAGHWLRVDIPEIEVTDDFVLYTDIDIIFCGLPSRLPAPHFLSVAPEGREKDWNNFNSGVMLMNIPAMRNCMNDFKDAIRKRLLGSFKYPTHDQASFNSFYGDKFDRLPTTMNWKPYWGYNKDAHIIHFHGPKREFIAGLERAQDHSKFNPALLSIWTRDVAAYEKYCELYDSFLSAPPPPSQEIRQTYIVHQYP